MEWIGFSRNDPNQTKFVFDDSVVLTSEPPQYNIRFLESGEQTSIMCSDVFKLKPVKPMKKTPVQRQRASVVEEIGETVTVPVVPVPTLTDDEEIQREIQEALRPKWNNSQQDTPTRIPDRESVTLTPEKAAVQEKKGKRKKKDDNTVSVVNTESAQAVLGISTRHKYEYKTILDDLDNTSQIEESLNGYGEDGWEMVNFEVTHSVLPGKSRLFCILKRIKE